VLAPGFRPGRTKQPTARGNGSPTRATANHEGFDTLEGSKPSWMSVALVELPFPLVVGYSVRPGWKPGLTRPPRLQGFVPPMRIGNFWYTGDAPLVVCPLLDFPFDLYGFLLLSAGPASRSILFWSCAGPPEGCRCCWPLELLRQFDSSLLSRPTPIVIFVSAFYLAVQGF
jgi:hypothetical protein